MTSANIRSSPRLAAAAAKRKTTTNGRSTTNNNAKARANGQLPPLPPFRNPRRPPLPPVINESQIDESQPLLSPEAPVEVINTTGRRTIVESQLTTSTGLGDDFLSSSDDNEDEADDGNGGIGRNGNGGGIGGDGNDEDGNDLTNFFDSNSGGDGFDDQSNDGMHGFSSGNEFEINERCSYYMDRAPITSGNRQAVEFVYMIEAETLCRGENTLKRPELAEKNFQRYKSLIRKIPISRFGQYGLQDSMLTRIYNSKAEKGSASGHYRTTVKVKATVQNVIRDIPTLPKLPSGRDIKDVRNDYIFRAYKAEMGMVLWLCSLLRTFQRHFTNIHL
jgi:hypothetical protein